MTIGLLCNESVTHFCHHVWLQPYDVRHLGAAPYQLVQTTKARNTDVYDYASIGLFFHYLFAYLFSLHLIYENNIIDHISLSTLQQLFKTYMVFSETLLNVSNNIALLQSIGTRKSLPTNHAPHLIGIAVCHLCHSDILGPVFINLLIDIIPTASIDYIS